MKKYNVIGDIHGRTNWKQLVISDGVNIFTGDYFSPYDKTYDFEHCKQNFLDIIHLKEEHPETILLVGNHDEEHWHWLEDLDGCSRYNNLGDNIKEIHDLFEKYKDYFQVAYSAGNKYLISHAGVSAVWLWRSYQLLEKGGKWSDFPLDYITLDYKEAKKFYSVNSAYSEHIHYFEKQFNEQNQNLPEELRRKYREPKNQLVYWKGCWYEPCPVCDYLGNTLFRPYQFTPDQIAHIVNYYWKQNPLIFQWKYNATHNDAWGNSIGQSPLWLRPPDVLEANIFRGNREYHQVVGHTRLWEKQGIHTESYKTDLRKIKEVIFVDCLETKTDSFVIEI